MSGAVVMAPLTYNLLQLVTTIIILVIFFHLYKFYQRYQRLALVSASIPSKKPLPIIGNTLQYLNLHNVLDVMYEDFKEFKSPTKGFIVHHLVVSVSDARQLQVILNSPHAIEKLDHYKGTDMFLSRGLITADHERWKVTRKLLSPTFHQKILESFVEMFTEQCEIMTNLLSVHVRQPVFDISKYVSLCAADTVCETAAGQVINAQTSNNNIYSHISSLLETYVMISLRPWISWNTSLMKRTSLGKKYLDAGNKIHEFIKTVLDAKKTELKTMQGYIADDEISGARKIFLDHLIEISQKTDLYSEKDLLGEVTTMIIAGIDTTSVAASFTFVMLGIHKDIQQKVYDELEEIFGDSDRSITMDDLRRMVYLERVVKETLRLYPSVPVIGRHINNDMKIGKHTIPQGTECLINLFNLHRNPDYWRDPEKFDPDRFSPEESVDRDPYAYLPFAGGPRTCIGRGYALNLIKTMVASVLRKYIVDCDMKLSDIKVRLEVVIKIHEGFLVRIQERAKHEY